MKSKDKKTHKKMVEDTENVCEVCRDSLVTNNGIFEKYSCKCNRWVHKFCYCPDAKDKKSFKCDQCKKNNSKGKCIICENNNGILKELNSSGSTLYAHVLCALTSPKIKISSYKNLEFKYNRDFSKKYNENRRCFVCQVQSDGTLACSPKCKNYAHANCILASKFGDDSVSYLIFGLMDKNENYLLKSLEEYEQKFKGLSLVKSKKPSIKIYCCHDHSNDPYFVWCPCKRLVQDDSNQSNKKDQKDNQDDQIQCSKCHRWFHLSCTDCKDPKKGDYYCKGCNQNNFFEKQVKIPELIQKMVEIQTSNKIDRANLKILDHFPFRLSEAILKILQQKKNIYEIQRYFLKKELIKYERKCLQSNEKAETKSSISELNVIETIYYIQKKQLKKQNDLSFEELKECLSEFSSMKHSRFEWLGTYEARVQKRFIKYLEDYLKNIEKCDLNGTRNKMELFIQKNKLHEPRQLKAVSHEIKQILMFIEKSEIFRDMLKNKNDADKNIFEILFDSKMNEDQIHQFLQRYKRIIILGSQKVINESEKKQILNKNYCSIDPKRNQIAAYFKEMLKDFKVKKQYEEKTEMLKHYEQEIQNNKFNFNQVGDIREKIVARGVFLGENSILNKREMSEMYYEVIKRKCLNSIKTAFPNEIQQIMTNIQILFEKNEILISLSENEQKEFRKFLAKQSFYKNLTSYAKKKSEEYPFYGMAADHQLMEIQNGEKQFESDDEMEQKNKNVSKSMKLIHQNAHQIMRQWGREEVDVNFALDELFVLASNKIQFHKTETEAIHEFADGILRMIKQRYLEFPKRMKPAFIEKVCKVIDYCKFSDYYQALVEFNKKYLEWKKVLEEKFYNINIFLESQSKVKDLANMVEVKIKEGETIEMDLEIEIKKLHILKYWCLISQRFLENSKRHTIEAIKQFKTTADKINYPENKVMSEINRLELQSRNLNRRIQKIFDKPRVTDLEPFQELRLLSVKLSYAEAEDLKRLLEATTLSVSYELEELDLEMKEIRNIERDLKKNIQLAHNSIDLDLMRRKILECAIRLTNLEDYEFLTKKYFSLRAKEFDGTINRKQYGRLLTYGGIAGIQLMNKTLTLHKAYKDIQRAEKQSINFKPRHEYLLPIDNKKIKNQLSCDQNEKANLEKWYAKSNELRNKFSMLKLGRTDLEKYICLQNELSCLPIYYRDISDQISRMRKELEEVTSKAQKFDNENEVSYDNQYFNDLVMRYKSLGVRTEYLDHLEIVCEQYKFIMDTAKRINIDNYKRFSLACQSALELTRNLKVNKAREDCFFTILKIALTTPDPLFQIYQTLLLEGGQICRDYRKIIDILPNMQLINQKYFKARERDFSDNDDSDEEEDDDNFDDDDDQQLNKVQNEDDEDEIDEIDEIDEDFRDNFLIPRKRHKGSELSEEVVDLDNDS